MFVLRQYTGLVLLVFVPLTGLFACCTVGYLLVMTGKKLTRMIVRLAPHEQERFIEPTSASLTRTQPRVIAAAGVEV